MNKKLLSPLGALALLFALSDSAPALDYKKQPDGVSTLKPGVAANIKGAPGMGGSAAGVQRLQPKGPIRLACSVDPAAQPLRVVHVRKGPDRTYVFYLVAPVKNLGSSTFRANRGQAEITLRMGTRVVNRQPLTVLAPGATRDGGTTISGWRLSDEFPPDFTLEISYDPDIRVDGNPENDDCRMTNNKATLSGAEVLRVLRTVP
ncbi:MAG TPA: hypothetical protein VF203_11775 [Burkholderiales bacterium]